MVAGPQPDLLLVASVADQAGRAWQLDSGPLRNALISFTTFLKARRLNFLKQFENLFMVRF